MKDETLAAMGKLIESELPRDAAHIAVVPITASRPLAAGEHIGLMPDGRAGGGADGVKAIGIVDPYLTVRVFEGDRFFLFLYPGSITSLKHLWTHPAFDGQAMPPPPIDPKAASEKWLRDFCDNADCPSYETVMGAVAEVADGTSNSWSGEYLHFEDRDAHGEIPAEFWVHAAVVLGRPIRGEKATGFSCSC